MNPYLYCRAGPVTLSDPSGLAPNAPVMYDPEPQEWHAPMLLPEPASSSFGVRYGSSTTDSGQTDQRVTQADLNREGGIPTVSAGDLEGGTASVPPHDIDQYYSDDEYYALGLLAGFMDSGFGGVLGAMQAADASKVDAGVGPDELPPGGLDWSGGFEGGLLADPSAQFIYGIAADLAFGAAVGAAATEGVGLVRQGIRTIRSISRVATAPFGVKTTGIGPRYSLFPSGAPPLGTLTAAEVEEIQAVANATGAEIDVIGSRAAGRGYNIDATHLPTKNTAPNAPLAELRSDIDFRYSTPGGPGSPQTKDLVNRLNRVSNGAGAASYPDKAPLSSYGSVIEFRPNALPIWVQE